MTKNANKLRAAHEKKKLAQQYDDYGNEIIEDTETGDDIPDEEPEIVREAYYENMLYGIIDGLTADFDANCASSMYGVVNGGFRAIDYKNVVDPRNSVKFQMAIN